MADSVEIPRERERLAIPRDLVDWINEHCHAGGWFRSHGDAAEKGLGRLRAERAFIERRGREAGVPFDAKAFYALYQGEVEAVATKTGRPPKASARLATDNVLIRATVAVELVEWANTTWLHNGPVDRLAQVVAIGIERLRAAGHLPDHTADASGSGFKPDEFWQLYRKTVAKSR